jgi:hypothetical protein
MATIFGVVTAHAACEGGRAARQGSRPRDDGRTYGRVRDALVVAKSRSPINLAIGAAMVAREAIRLKAVPIGSDHR